MIEILILTAALGCTEVETHYVDAAPVAPVQFFVKNKPVRKRLWRIAERKPVRRGLARVADRVRERPRLRAVRGLVTGRR